MQRFLSKLLILKLHKKEKRRRKKTDTASLSVHWARVHCYLKKKVTGVTVNTLLVLFHDMLWFKYWAKKL